MSKANLQSRIKNLFTEEALSDTFGKELYKKVRNTAKKLEQISNIEEKLKNKEKITPEQQEKLQAKQSLTQSVDEIMTIFDLYRRN